MDREKFESLLTLRFDERNLKFQRKLTNEIERVNGRGLLHSSMCVQALHTVLRQEFEDSSGLIIITIIDTIRENKTIPVADKLSVIYEEKIMARKNVLESIFKGRVGRITESLLNKNMIANFINLNNEERLVIENGKVELKKKIDGYKKELGGDLTNILISKWKDNKFIASLLLIVFAYGLLESCVRIVKEILTWIQ